MGKVTEIEMRGPIDKAELETLRNELNGRATLKEVKNRVLIDYTTLLEGQDIENRSTDIRVRNTNGKSEIIVKTGKWGGSDIRDEFKVSTTDSFDSLVQVMRLLGYTKGVLCVRNSEVYQLGEVEIALVEVPGHSYYFEAEIETEDEHDANELSKRIIEKISGLGLQIFSDEDFYAYIRELNENANTVFDTKDEPSDFFRKKFNVWH